MASAERLRAAIPVAGGYLQRVGGWIIYAAAYTWAVLRMLVAIVGDYLGPPLAPVGDFLRRPGIRIAVLVAGSVALLGGIIRAFANGFVTDTLIALIVGAGLLIALALAHASSGLPTWLTSRVGPPLGRLSAFIEQAWARPSVQKGLAIGVLVVAVGFALHAFGFTQSQPDRGSATRALRSERSSPPPAARADNAADIAGRLRSAAKLPRDEAAALFNANQSELIEAARAHGELLQWEAFTDALARVTDEGSRQVLTWLRDLFGLSMIEKHLAWYLINGRLSAQRGGAVSSYIDRLCVRLRPHSLDLVEAFGFAPEHVRAPIASGAEKVRQDEARAYYAALEASGSAPVPEKKGKTPTRA